MAGFAGKKSYKLSIYLLKKTVVNFHDAIKDPRAVDEYKLKGVLKLNGVIYLGKTKYNDFDWQRLLQAGTDKTLPRLENASNRAVLLMKIEGRIFALPFGFGKHLLNEETIEREFGLRTALNLIDADKLRSMDKANLDDLTVLTKTQTSRRAKPQEFNLDIIRDLMRGVTGEPSAGFEELGATITGSEGLYIIPKIHFEDISEHLQTLGKAYASKAYRARFDWIDNLKSERDPALIAKLQDKLIVDLKAQDDEKIQLSPPFIIDWEDYEGFSFTPSGELKIDLDIQTFYSEREEDLDDLDWEKLKRFKLYIKYGNLPDKIPVALWRSLNYQTTQADSLYVFAFAQWYKVNKKYSEAIKEYVEKIPESKLKFVDCDHGMVEGSYNIKLASSDKTFALFDKKLVKSGAIRSSIEVCDIFATKEKELVHVKFKGASSVLSHLFAQGKISGNLLARDISFRKNVRAKLKLLGFPVKVVPLEESRFDTSRYTITFAIIGDEKKGFVKSLPFFSLLNLRLTAEELRIIGFKVKVKIIKYL